MLAVLRRLGGTAVSSQCVRPTLGPEAVLAMSCVIHMQHQTQCRWHATERRFSSLQDDLDILGQDAGLIRIDSCVPGGFIVGENTVKGPLLVAGGLLTSWNVHAMDAISDDSLRIVDLLKPVPDILVLGTGERMEQIPPALRDLLVEKHLALEVASTVNAVTTFNILNQEGRKVVGAFFPLPD